MKNSNFPSIFKYFLRGLLYTVPLALTVYIIYQPFIFIDGLVPFPIPGLGILTFFAFITLVGLLGSSFLLRPLRRYWDELLTRLPLVKTIYSAIHDLMSAFVGDKKRFNVPVLVQLSKDAQLERLGFITQEDLTILGIDQSKVAVYLPHSYNVSGNVYIVPRESVQPLDANSAEVMKFIVSGGVTDLDQAAHHTES